MPRRIVSIAAALAVLVACRTPFGTDRHDLVGFRVVGVEADLTSASSVSARAVVLVDGHLWSDAAPELRWYWLPGEDPASEVDGIAIDAPADAVGPRADLALPDALPAALGLVAIAPDGEVDRAFLELSADAVSLPSMSGLELGELPLTVATVDGPDLDVDARRALATTPATRVPDGGFARLTVLFAGEVDPAVVVRWMAVDGVGTFLELEPLITDLADGTLVLDGEDLDAAEPESAEMVSVVALAIGGLGVNRIGVFDLPIGEGPAGLTTSAGRFLPADDDIAAGTYLVELAEDDAAPSGVRVATVAPLGADDPPDLPCGASVGAPFDPSWLADGRCTRAEVVGVPLRVVAR